MPSVPRTCLALAVLAAGCDQLFALQPLKHKPDAGVEGVVDATVSSPDSGSRCVVDTFDTLGPQWRTFANPPGASVAVNGSLQVTLADAANVYAGIETTARDFTGYTIEVEIVAVPGSAEASAADTYLDWAQGAEWYSIAVDFGKLSYGYSTAAKTVTLEIPFVPSAHRAFRMRHDQQANLVRMSVRDSGGVWAELGTAPIVIPMTSLRVEIASGSYTQQETSGTARFDNYVECAP